MKDKQFRFFIEAFKDLAIFMADPSGILISWNLGVHNILGYREQEFIGCHVSMLFTPGDMSLNAWNEGTRAANVSGQAGFHRTLQRKGGALVVVEGSITSVKDRNGRLQGFGVVLSRGPVGAFGELKPLLGGSGRVNELRHAAEGNRATISEIFMQAPAFMAALRGPDHVFEMVNPAYSQLIGHRSVIGKSVREALPEVVKQGYIDLLNRVYSTGERFIGNDIPIMLQRNPDGPVEERYMDFNYIPLFDDDGSISGILAHGIDLTERKLLEQERERLLAEERVRAKEQALLNKIGAAIRSAVGPEEVYETAVALLGEALQADRCYFNTYDAHRSVFRIGRDWHREDLPSMSGLYTLSELNQTYQELYKPGQTTGVYEDIDTAALSEDVKRVLKKYGLRSFLGVALADEDGLLIASLRAAMVDKPRVWTQFEISLVEAVADMVRTAVEKAQIQQRERNIAHQLQAALQPAAPPDLPGLALKSYYLPALAEASVGGDFYDVFPLEKNCTAMVVGDLSGKGLAAASEVATVRNMLRSVLYMPGTTLSAAVTLLNQMLAEHRLLRGFATLFVGLYDHAARTLLYANCGQEPALVWRAASNSVEQLPPTGPVLGGFYVDCYSEDSISLVPGDVIAAFTDGLTEAGPSRRNLLGLSGVAAIFSECCASAADVAVKNGPSPTADVILTDVVSRVQTFAKDGVADDICVLLGVVDKVR